MKIACRFLYHVFVCETNINDLRRLNELLRAAGAQGGREIYLRIHLPCDQSIIELLHCYIVHIVQLDGFTEHRIFPKLKGEFYSTSDSTGYILDEQKAKEYAAINGSLERISLNVGATFFRLRLHVFFFSPPL